MVSLRIIFPSVGIIFDEGCPRSYGVRSDEKHYGSIILIKILIIPTSMWFNTHVTYNVLPITCNKTLPFGQFSGKLIMQDIKHILTYILPDKSQSLILKHVYQYHSTTKLTKNMLNRNGPHLQVEKVSYFNRIQNVNVK